MARVYRSLGERTEPPPDPDYEARAMRRLGRTKKRFRMVGWLALVVIALWLGFRFVALPAWAPSLIVVALAALAVAADVVQHRPDPE